jgi:hypothetical protein
LLRPDPIFSASNSSHSSDRNAPLTKGRINKTNYKLNRRDGRSKRHTIKLQLVHTVGLFKALLNARLYGVSISLQIALDGCLGLELTRFVNKILIRGIGRGFHPILFMAIFVKVVAAQSALSLLSLDRSAVAERPNCRGPLLSVIISVAQRVQCGRFVNIQSWRLSKDSANCELSAFCLHLLSVVAPRIVQVT